MGLLVFFMICFAPSVYCATIDIMIVFDTKAKTWADQNGGMKAVAANAAARLNQAVNNSDLDLSFRLVHTANVSYTYSGNLSTDLDRLQSGTGNLSSVLQWRNTYGADLVIMMVDTGSESGWVGQGYLLTTYQGDPEYAFSVCAIRAVAVSHTMTHEIGHNLGCQHSKKQKDAPGPNSELNSYSAGWYFTGTNSTKYNTIMAYSDDGYGNEYTEAPLFSTPLMSYEGTAAGDAADGDNARTIKETMNVAAAYRAAKSYLYAAFSNAGIWKYSGTGTIWAQATPNNPQQMVASGSTLYGTFTGSGIWKFDDSSWTQATASNPAFMVTDGTNLYGSFTGNGIWKFDGSTWIQVTPNVPHSMVTLGRSLYGSFTGGGIWKFDGISWTQATPNNPDLMVTTPTTLYGTFPGAGVWKFNGTDWVQVATSNPQVLVSSGETLYGSFAGGGIWKWNGSVWSQVTSSTATLMKASSSILYGVFTGSGLWKYDGTVWTQIAPGDPENVVVGE